MRQVRTAGWLLSLLMAAAMVTQAFITPGLRHQHEHGHAAHSHRGHHHRPHSHRHPHPASHHPRRQPQTTPSNAHIHLTLFGFELTLPDFFGTGEAPVTEPASDAPRLADRTPASGQRVTRPCTSAEIVQLLLQIRMLRPAHVVAPLHLDSSRRGPCEQTFCPGRQRPAPPVPPPRTDHVA